MQHILEIIKSAFPESVHQKLFLVGGSVRDRSMDDVDITAMLSKEEILSLGGIQVESKSTAPVFIVRHEILGDIQISQPRVKETKTGTGHNGFKFQVELPAPGDELLSLEKDLFRRDFTVNAMAMTLGGKLIDPFNGMTDLANKHLRHVSDAFGEDPDRVFRGYRFCARGFEFHPETREYIRNLDLAADFAALPPNRVFSELLKALKAPFPHLFFEELVRTGKGKEFFPEVFQMTQIPAGPGKFHGEDTVFEHSCDVLRKVSAKTDDPVIRCAAFFHDLGKILTPADQLPRHFDHDILGEDVAETVLRRIKAPKDFIRSAKVANTHHMKGSRFNEMRPSSKILFAGEVAKFGQMIPLIVKADADVEMARFNDCVQIANLSATQLGIPVEKLKGMASTDISSFIISEKVKVFKTTAIHV